MEDNHSLETLFSEHNYTDFKWLDPKEISACQFPETRIASALVSLKFLLYGSTRGGLLTKSLNM